MAPKRHGFGKRKRKGRKSHPYGKKSRNDFPDNGDKLKDKELLNKHEDSSSESEISDEEVNPYQQLVSSLTNPTGLDNSSEGEEDSSETDKDVDDNDKADNDEDEETSEVEDEEGNNEAGDDKEEDVEPGDNEGEEDSESDEKDLLTVEDLPSSDPFVQHFNQEVSEDSITKLSKSEWTKIHTKIPHLGSCTVRSLGDSLHKFDHTNDLTQMHVKPTICKEIKRSNSRHCSIKDSLTPLQTIVFKVLNKYQDLYFPCRTMESGEQLRLVYCLHALNHVLKNRKQVISHNTTLKTPGHEDSEFRDQGLTRPKVLMVLPFRESALRVVNIMISLLKSDPLHNTSNRKRFFSEYKEDTSDQKKGLKPEDYEAIFSGNIDDHFRIGLGIAKKTLKIYTEFYSADIILASPLGLRTLIGSEGDKERDYDFLNSIDVLIFDQADILLMQNWDHIMHLMKHLHLQPSQSHGTDFSRVRMWTLNGWNKYYRQTVLLSSVGAPQLLSLFNKHCFNYGGKIAVHRPDTNGTISHIVLQLPQVYHKINCSSFSQLADDRFNLFIQKILPTQKDPVLSQTLIYVPSYFDFVRLRNHFVREDLSFVHICEYSKDKSISRSRNQFFHGNAHFMLYTERVHFYRRFKIRGIQHVIFYELPLYPHFYSEICNMLLDKKQTNSSCTVLYSQYDVQKLTEIVGSERASHMVSSSKNVHMFVTGE